MGGSRGFRQIASRPSYDLGSGAVNGGPSRRQARATECNPLEIREYWFPSGPTRTLAALCDLAAQGGLHDARHVLGKPLAEHRAQQLGGGAVELGDTLVGSVRLGRRQRGLPLLVGSDRLLYANALVADALDEGHA